MVRLDTLNTITAFHLRAADACASTSQTPQLDSDSSLLGLEVTNTMVVLTSRPSRYRYGHHCLSFFLLTTLFSDFPNDPTE